MKIWNRQVEFEYNDEGLLISYNIPEQGRIDWKSILEYDGGGRLIRRAETRGGDLVNELTLTYLSPYRIKGEFVYQENQYGTYFFYYNLNNELDSMILESLSGFRAKHTFKFSNGNIQSREVHYSEPPNNDDSIVEVNYDDGINPFYLLKLAANNFGMETLYFQPSSIEQFMANQNNELERRYNVLIKNFYYEYYPDSRYVKRIKKSIDAETGLVFEYEECH